ncbi:hypothetical protein VFPFJ_07662 [Purpureocillium lilacinum]|uniref:Uncharacterized protein n=1 Tax=Purpureocillium lilacinum TaxID=33203 RepID=A0A179GIP4_PURLI|nr:hypothetical protein VFPFJ_07662 [Purpureocillium lilacinum]OAQ77724.1 hypothetical protein VFPBJ_08196 [Purpureocillium lilacinum]OAQ85273.1 hypothetical protein VFPFJ_07662 [Purpureocillium lilacinum]
MDSIATGRLSVCTSAASLTWNGPILSATWPLVCSVLAPIPNANKSKRQSMLNAPARQVVRRL